MSTAQRAFGGRHGALHARIRFNGHAYRPAKSLEYRFNLVMGIVAAQIVDVQCDLGVIDEALENS